LKSFLQTIHRDELRRKDVEAVKAALLDAIDRREDNLVALSRKIWEFAELALQEHKSAKAIIDELEQEGFDIETGVAGIPTAFYASYSIGTGKPVIGIMGEYDALPGTSQDTTPYRKPIKEGAPGHACGHNLLGVGALAAVLAVKEVMESEGIDGTIRYYGCPAEETLIGKVFMVRAGAFDDVDAALTWHPGQANVIREGSSTAVNSAKFKFFGVTSHAAAAPEAGRSALDGVELMNVGANYLREHVSEKIRIHYVITDGGGSPNVVPAEAESWYYVRGPHRDEVEEVYDRLCRIAESAANMTDTTVEENFLAGCYDCLHNQSINQRLYEHMKAIGGPKFTAEEKEFAAKLQADFSRRQIQNTAELYNSPELADTVLHEDIVGPHGWEPYVASSTDVGDVSWVTPTSQFRVACCPVGAPFHTWPLTACTGMGIGQKAMLFASKVLALTAADLLTDNELLEAATSEFKEATQDNPYKSPLPADLQPPLD